MDSFYQETSKYSNKNKNKNTKLPSIKSGSGGNGVPVWDTTAGGGIPEYDSVKDRFCSISQIKKFNQLHKTKHKSLSGSALTRNQRQQQHNSYPSSSPSSASASLSSQTASNLIDSSLQRQRLLQQNEQQHQNQVNQIHNDWNSQRITLETYLSRKIKSRELILVELKLLINSYLDHSSAGSDEYDNEYNNANNHSINNSNGMNNILTVHTRNNININQVEVTNLLNVLRSQTLEIVEGIQEWKQHFTVLLPTLQPNLRHSQNFASAAYLGIAANNSEYDNTSTLSTVTSDSMSVIHNLNSTHHTTLNTVLPSFQHNNENYLMKISKDLDFLDVFEKKFKMFGFEFQYNPLAYKDGGSVITMFNQRFDHMNNDDNISTINVTSISDGNSPYQYNNKQNTTNYDTTNVDNTINTAVTTNKDDMTDNGLHTLALTTLHTSTLYDNNRRNSSTSTGSSSSSSSKGGNNLKIIIKSNFNSPTAGTGALKSPFFARSPQNKHQKSPLSHYTSLQKLNKSVDGFQFSRLQAAEKAIQWEYDLVLNPALASQAQLQHEYFLRHGYNPKGNNNTNHNSASSTGHGNGEFNDNNNNNNENEDEEDDINNIKKRHRKKLKSSKVKYIMTDKLSLALARGNVNNITGKAINQSINQLLLLIIVVVLITIIIVTINFVACVIFVYYDYR